MTEQAELPPYVGPRPFGRSLGDRERFFGRDREAAEIVSLILSHPIVVVHAQSGAGKTSLFEAKITEALERKRIHVFPPARVRPGLSEGVDESERGNVYTRAALLCIAPDEPAETLAAKSLTEFVLEHRGEAASARCVVFDQFEELLTDQRVYTLHPQDWEAHQAGFFREIADAVRSDPLLRIVLLVRDEYLAELGRFAGLVPERLETGFHLEPLSRRGALEAVTRPVESTNRKFDDGVAEELVEELLTMRVDFEGQTFVVRGRFVEPLHLQLVCQSLWSDLDTDQIRITADDLHAHGGVDQVLTEHYDHAIRAAAAVALGPETGLHLRRRVQEARLRRWIESEFIASTGTRMPVFAGGRSDSTAFAPAVRELEARGVLRRELWAGSRTYYELTHDRLVDPIKASNARRRAEAAARRTWWLAGLLAVIAAGAVAVVAGRIVDNGPATWRVITTLRSEKSPSLAGVAFSPDGVHVATVAADGVARVWNTATRTHVDLVSAGSPTLTAVAFGPDGKHIVTAGADGYARVWDVGRQTSVDLGVSASAALTDAAFAGGEHVVTAGEDGLAYIWDVERRASILLGSPGAARLTGVAVTADGKRIVTVSENGVARVWNVTRRSSVSLVPPKLPQLTDVAVSSSGSKLATAGADGIARLWDVTRRTSVRFGSPGSPLSGVAFSPDGRHLATADAGGVAKIWDIERRTSFRLSSSGPRALTGVAFSPDGKRVVTAGADGWVRIYARTGGSG